MQNLASIRQLGAELRANSHTKLSFAIPLLKTFFMFTFTNLSMFEPTFISYQPSQSQQEFYTRPGQKAAWIIKMMGQHIHHKYSSPTYLLVLYILLSSSRSGPRSRSRSRTKSNSIFNIHCQEIQRKDLEWHYNQTDHHPTPPPPLNFFKLTNKRFHLSISSET